MKTVAELEKHLNEYREKNVEFPTYEELVELVQEANTDFLLKTLQEKVDNLEPYNGN